MSQAQRNALYGVALAVGVVVKTFGWAQPEVVDVWVANAAEGLALAAAALAFYNSLRSKRTVLDAPVSAVAEVVAPDGTVTAGPASPAPTGTVLKGRHMVIEGD